MLEDDEDNFFKITWLNLRRKAKKLVYDWESLKAFMLAKYGVYDEEKL